MRALEQHRFVPMATTATIRMLVRHTAITGRATLQAACLSALGPGITTTTDAAFMAALVSTARVTAIEPDLATGPDMLTGVESRAATPEAAIAAVAVITATAVVSTAVGHPEAVVIDN